MFTALFYIIIIIIAVDFLLERYLEWLNIRHSAGELPDLLKDIFDNEKYGLQQAYLKENYRFGIWTSGFNFIILMLMLLFSGFSWVNNLTASLSSNPVWWALAFVGIIMLDGRTQSLCQFSYSN